MSRASVLNQIFFKIIKKSPRERERLDINIYVDDKIIVYALAQEQQ